MRIEQLDNDPKNLYRLPSSSHALIFEDDDSESDIDLVSPSKKGFLGVLDDDSESDIDLVGPTKNESHKKAKKGDEADNTANVRKKAMKG
ncbi:hypothetical protein MBM_01627 [Drepanopeziza brunnea f. sp. 'multigermtubi' MB_m1]|uniref:Uncharacterized protein n=1 Tax=Marssonina brunnea f. sp. multigermtubi (strain MB_m1) TaxID=1072389 RepID=K1WQ15_MARBU|nr:uncharacterized protein MBM_01627 [Drepanopeziza brunnea f. sp. 'multigermtubi' MB_m1]EKD19675.1 hypothetical protein MBM_01627 [Drepanopeziza brunnea f. sp. 'multigermtubi' MB_m1]